jgi:hypothetical protein
MICTLIRLTSQSNLLPFLNFIVKLGFSLMNNEIDLYTEAHLFVAAVRILSHTKNTPPALDHVCQLLAISLERGGVILRRLKKEDIVEVVQQSHKDRLFINAHLNIEIFKHAESKSDLDKALDEFKSEKQNFSKKIESIKADQAKKKEDLFAKLNSQLKKEAETKPS